MDKSTNKVSEFVDYFKTNFYERLKTPEGNNPVRNRADSLLLIFEILAERNQDFYRILETGCMRPDHGDFNFGGDGCATYIFDQFCQRTELGSLVSVDTNPINTDYARTKVSAHTNIICSDSVYYLHHLALLYKPFDVVYLDSYDIDKHNPHPSQLHHLKELSAVMKNTKSGTLVCVDDHDAFFTGGKIGKGNYVKEYMESIGAKIIYEGYQIVFILP